MKSHGTLHTHSHTHKRSLEQCVLICWQLLHGKTRSSPQADPSDPRTHRMTHRPSACLAPTRNGSCLSTFFSASCLHLYHCSSSCLRTAASCSACMIRHLYGIGEPHGKLQGALWPSGPHSHQKHRHLTPPPSPSCARDIKSWSAKLPKTSTL